MSDDQTLLNAVAQPLANLYERWVDEHEYEDIEEYGQALQRILPDDVKLTRMTQRPFGFHFTRDGKTFHRVYVKASRSRLSFYLERV